MDDHPFRHVCLEGDAMRPEVGDLHVAHTRELFIHGTRVDVGVKRERIGVHRFDVAGPASQVDEHASKWRLDRRLISGKNAGTSGGQPLSPRHVVRVVAGHVGGERLDEPRLEDVGVRVVGHAFGERSRRREASGGRALPVDDAAASERKVGERWVVSLPGE